MQENPFDTNHFFSLKHFAQRQIFQVPFIWNALENLENFFHQFSFQSDSFSEMFPSVFFENPSSISIGKDSIIEPGAYIQGPCIIGDGCHIRHGAYVRSFVIMGNGCVVGHATEIKHSILLNEVHAAHFNYVGDSIIGSRVNLGAGSICANKRLDKNTISFVYENKRYETSLMKLGAIIGDESQIGCNTVMNPATFIGKNCICFPSLNVKGVIKDSSIIKEHRKSLQDVYKN